MNMPTEQTAKLHPFEAAGMGTGPYRYLFSWSFPSKSLAEANPEAYNSALRDMPRDISNGCGTCARCGQAIMTVCVVSDSSGKRYGVGSDCVLRAGDPSLGDPLEVDLAKKRREQARQKREVAWKARQEKYLNEVMETGETRREMKEREAQEREREALESKSRVMAKWGFMLEFLDGGGPFCQSISDGIKNGQEPTGRAVSILRDIYAKSHGKWNSKAYCAAADRFDALLEGGDGRTVPIYQERGMQR